MTKRLVHHRERHLGRCRRRCRRLQPRLGCANPALCGRPRAASARANGIGVGTSGTNIQMAPSSTGFGPRRHARLGSGLLDHPTRALLISPTPQSPQQ